MIDLISTHKCIWHKTDSEKVKKYRMDIISGDIFPPVKVIYYKGKYVVIDGAHRTAAHNSLGIYITADVVDYEDACENEKMLTRKRYDEFKS